LRQSKRPSQLLYSIIGSEGAPIAIPAGLGAEFRMPKHST